MTITKYFDNPDDALAFVEEEILEFNACDLPDDCVTFEATYPNGKFTRIVHTDDVPCEEVVYSKEYGLDVVGRGSYTELVFGDITHDTKNPTLSALFAGFNTIFGGKQ